MPQGRLTNLWQHITRFDSPLSYPPMGIGASFWWRDVLPYQPVWIREETLESENLFSAI